MSVKKSLTLIQLRDIICTMLEGVEGSDIMGQIVSLEKHFFPEFDGSKALISPDTRYTYFSPTSLLNHGILDLNGLLEVVYNNKALLSVGAGRGYLERMLVYLGARKENIVLSDIDQFALPTGYRNLSFDMTEQWPEFGQKFDFVVFPQSLVGVSSKHNFSRGLPYLEDMGKCFEQAYSTLNPGGQIRAVGGFASEVPEYIRTVFKDREVEVQADQFHLLVVKDKARG